MPDYRPATMEMPGPAGASSPLNLTFLMRSFDWPPRTGSTVHTGNLMRCLAAAGHRVRFLTMAPVDQAASGYLPGVQWESIRQPAAPASIERMKRWQKSLRYWGGDVKTLAAFHDAVRESPSDAVIAVGLDTLPFLAAVGQGKTIWYPADDPILHEYSLIRQQGFSWGKAKHVIRTARYERSFRGKIDAVWVVSPRDQTWMRRVGGFRQVDVIPNGVDADFFQPQHPNPLPRRCAFWGTLDFPPNEHAVDYFLSHVWPAVLKQRPDADFRVMGVSPKPALRRRLAGTQGVVFLEALEDLRPQISDAAVAVFPMVSGGGVKNKVLEAAAMGRAICATPRCLNGLHRSPAPPFRLATGPDEWVSTLLRLWDHPQDAARLGQQMRAWVMAHHGWPLSASAAINSIHRAIG